MTHDSYDDTLYMEHATGEDALAMRHGVHYDYQAQVWREGHDHAHIVSNDDTSPLMFCGSDRGTCQRGNPEAHGIFP